MPRAVFAQEESVGTDDDRVRAVKEVLAVLKNVVGISVDAYDVQVLLYSPKLNLLKILLEANESKLEVFYNFESTTITFKEGSPVAHGVTAYDVTLKMALDALRSMVGLDVTAYNTRLISYRCSLGDNNSLSIQAVKCSLEANGSKLTVEYIFAPSNECLAVSVNEGSLLMLQGSEESVVKRALNVLRNVVGFNVDAYNWGIRACGKDLFEGFLPHEFVGFDFWNDESQLTAYVKFVDGKLQSIDISVQKGVPLMVQMVQQAANEVEWAKSFLSRYQAYCGATHVEEFKAILDTVKPKTNTVKVYGNIKFEAEYTKPFVEWENRTIDTARFAWIYTFNGVVASSKWVGLAFENGYFSFFIDNWNFYKIGSYDINVDEKKAIEIALNAAKNYSTRVYMGYDTWITVSNFKVVGAKAVALTFANGLSKQELRDGNPLILYPVWTVEVYFDNVYAGGVYGVDIDIWADTGEVWRIFPLTGPLGSLPSDMVPIESGGNEGQESSENQTGDEEQEHHTPDGDQEQEPITPDDTSNNVAGLNLTQIALIALPICVGIALGIVKVCSKRRRKPNSIEELNQNIKAQ